MDFSCSEKELSVHDLSLYKCHPSSVPLFIQVLPFRLPYREKAINSLHFKVQPGGMFFRQLMDRLH